MKVILNRDVKNLGKVGDICEISDGYGRNFLIPKGYVSVATKASIIKLQEKLEELKKKNEELCNKAKQVASFLENEILNIARQSADDDTIYGSVKNRDVFNLINDLLKKNSIDFTFDIGAIKLENTIKALGKYIVDVNLFGDVSVNVRLNVCRTNADFESDVIAFDKKRKAMIKAEEKKDNEAQKQSNVEKDVVQKDIENSATK